MAAVSRSDLMPRVYDAERWADNAYQSRQPKVRIMTPDERAQLIEDIRRSTSMRERILEQATTDKDFDIAAAWETLDELDQSINTRMVEARSSP